jgi:hypothetical protein
VLSDWPGAAYIGPRPPFRMVSDFLDFVFRAAKDARRMTQPDTRADMDRANRRGAIS